ncbi:MAG: 1-(5-phosphoribosyl)-5-[(5-phosphoribosylamino)methylideneamino] imidazole-4-carboxamide isomerase [Pseudoruegeria sp.]
MILYPTIELQNGRCVSLQHGRLEAAQIWHVDPIETAKGFAIAGAEAMHITDFDAIVGSDTSTKLVHEIIRVAGVPVQVGGGIRSRDQVEAMLDAGAARVVVGTLAALDPQMVKDLAKFYPDQIVLAVDVWQGKVMTEGWKTTSAFEPADFIAEFANAPLASILVTDIDADLEDQEASLSLITTLAASTRTPVIASGIVRSVDDLARLKYVSNVHGAIVGRALFRKNIDLAAAIAVAVEQPEPRAEFQ